MADHQGAEALKPCPFCGGSAEITERDVEPQGDPWYGKRVETFVVCACGACLFDGDFHEGFYDAETRAVAAWNRRPAPASDLRAAAQAVVDRWDSPQWKDEPHTAEFINRLRRALEAVGGDGLPELPKGWRIVPERPTPEMAEAFAAQLSGACGSFFDWDRGGDEGYRALLDAAPKWPGGGERAGG